MPQYYLGTNQHLLISRCNVKRENKVYELSNEGSQPSKHKQKHINQAIIKLTYIDNRRQFYLQNKPSKASQMKNSDKSITKYLSCLCLQLRCYNEIYPLTVKTMQTYLIHRYSSYSAKCGNTTWKYLQYDEYVSMRYSCYSLCRLIFANFVENTFQLE